MTYSETLDYMFAQLPMYSRVGASAYKANLDNALAFDKILKYPHKHFKTIHIAGTNGKGSTSHSLASILQKAGYKVGLYTSPHLLDFRERIRVNGIMIDETYVVNFINDYKSKFEPIQPSFFELTMGMAFKYFEDEKVEIAIIETGMGGRLDSTNIISPILSIITNISYDHQQHLGATLPLIAGEKAGIIKFNIPVVIGQKNEETDNVFEAKAQEMNSEISFAEDIFKVIEIETGTNFQTIQVEEKKANGSTNTQDYELDLMGHYQAKNIKTILAACNILNTLGLKIEIKTIKEALKSVKSTTGLRGRWEILRKSPLTIADTAHNVDGISATMTQLAYHAEAKVHIVFGMVNDKDITKVLELLPKTYHYYFTEANIPRAMPAEELMLNATNAGLSGNAYKTVAEAITAAQQNAKKEDTLYIGGSTFVVADALPLYA